MSLALVLGVFLLVPPAWVIFKMATDRDDREQVVEIARTHPAGLAAVLILATIVVSMLWAGGALLRGALA